MAFPAARNIPRSDASGTQHRSAHLRLNAGIAGNVNFIIPRTTPQPAFAGNAGIAAGGYRGSRTRKESASNNGVRTSRTPGRVPVRVRAGTSK
jgi:hypothetical protein